MANGISSGDVISKSKRSELVSDPSVTSVVTTPTDDEDKVEVTSINFREPEQAPTRTREEETARQREIQTGDPRPSTEVDVQPGFGPDTQETVDTQLQNVSEQIQQVQSLESGRQVQIGGQTLTKQEATQALTTRREELEQLQSAVGEQNIEAEVSEAPITEGGIDVNTISVSRAETVSPEEEFRPRFTRFDQEPETQELTAKQEAIEQRETIPDPIDVEEREQAQDIQRGFEWQRRQQEALEQFREADELLTPSELKAELRGEKLQETQQRRDEVQQQIQQLNQARERGIQTVQFNGATVPISEAQEQLEQTELELRASEDVQTQQVLETIDITEAPSRTEAVQLETQRLRELPTDELAARFAGDLAEFTTVSAAELGVETVTTAAGLGLGDELFDERRPEPDIREQFRDLTPSLIAAQERGAQIGQRFSEALPEGTERAAADITTDVLGATLPGGLAVTQLPQSERFAQTQIQRLPEALGAEVPEKLTEIGGSFGVVERTIEAPIQTITTGATGAGQIAAQAAEAPTEFYQTEIVPDVGLDLLAGGLAPTVIPRAGEVIPDTQQVRDAFTQTRTGQLGTTETIDTVEPDVVTDVGPDTPTPEPDIEVVEPLPTVEPDTTPVTQTEPATQPVTQPEPVTAPAPVTEPVTQPDAVTEPAAITEPLTEPITQPLSQPISQIRTEPLSEPVVETQVQVQPRPQPRPQPQTRPRVLPRPDQDQDLFDVAQDLGVSEVGGRGTELTPSIGSVFTGRTQEREDIQDEFTGLEQRPIPIETENGDVEDDTDDVEEELTGLF